MRVLVTGSAGHLGEALVRRLREGGHAPLGLDLLASPFTGIVGSIADRALVLAHLGRSEDPRSELARAVGSKGYHA